MSSVGGVKLASFKHGPFLRHGVQWWQQHGERSTTVKGRAQHKHGSGALLLYNMSCSASSWSLCCYGRVVKVRSTCVHCRDTNPQTGALFGVSLVLLHGLLVSHLVSLRAEPCIQEAGECVRQ